MKNWITLFLGLCSFSPSFSQSAYWQQELHYRIDVTLNDKEHSLDGFLKLDYKNQSPDTLNFIWFHLWPNAYKNDKTAFSEQLLQNGRTDFYFSPKEKRGYINRLDFRTDNNTLKTADHPLYIDMVKVFLLKPLAPGQQTTISTPFHVQLPYNFSRGGHSGQSYQITQWFPKPAVYDKEGWHQMPYLDQGEFYSEFGNFEVQITLPSNYVVAATGELQNDEEKKWLLDRRTFKMPEIVKPKSNTKSFKKPDTENLILIPSSSTSKTLVYKQDNIHDFAWFADKTYVVDHDTIQLSSGRTIDAYNFYWPKDANPWSKGIIFIKEAIKFRSNLIGEYPYNTASVVEAKMGFEGGMEYPTITSISPSQSERSLDEVIEHELGHNWFYGILASNERKHPWMDEGMNSYFDHRYAEAKFKDKLYSPKSHLPESFEQLLVNTFAVTRKDQPIGTPSDSFSLTNYGLTAYIKTANWLSQLEKEIGREKFDAAFREYYNQWKFKHPQPADFFQSLEKNTGKSSTVLNTDINKRGLLNKDSVQKKQLRFTVLPNLAETNKYHYINILPAPGKNFYDGFMLGVIIHNYNLPPSPFQFYIAPQYGFKSNKVNGIGRFGYTWRKEGAIEKIIASVGGEKYSYLSGVDSNNQKISAGFYKFTPALRIYFKEASARSSREKWLEWKTYLIGESSFDYKLKSTDSLYYPSLGSTVNRYLNQVTYSIADYRALYPFDVQLQVQQAKDFYRINFTANYFLNYASGGGASVRVFAGKFGYLGTRTSAKEFATTNFQPKLTAVRGGEDYTYSNYFTGRNETDGFNSQQIMMRDGGLKLRTDLFQGLQGRSENWVASINLTTSIPSSILPKVIPLKLFLDAGSYAEAWKKDANTQKFLFVGGLQLSLINNIVNIYAPLVYSKDFSNNLKTVPEENKFLRKISFSIDIQRISIRRMSKNQLPF